MMEDNKICVDAKEFERLCKISGRMDALISYLELEDVNYTTRPIRAIIGMEMPDKE